MKRLVLALLCWLPLLAAAQSVPVPATLDFAGLHLRLTDGGRRAVQQKVDALRSHPASFQARVNLADAYFPIIERVFQEEALPLDFRFLAIQESGLQGEAQSIHDAVGYWQFKRESAADFAVVMNDAVDERKHIVASTHAAAKYLKRNNNALHNWVNALLSYNLGSGGVKPYTLPTDYDATEMEISEQTHPYVLTMLAHKLAYEPAVGHNPKPPMMLQEFPAPAGQPLSILAQSLQVEPAELLKHNRWLLAATVPTDKIYTVLVPITDPIQLTALAAQQKNATAGQLLNAPQPDPQNAEYVRVNGLRALVALPGETKESLAKRAGLKVRKFMQFNDLFAFDNIVAGQPYFVQKKRDKAAVEYHVAQPGESVSTVSQKYGIRAKAIWSKNRMPRNEELRPGRILWLQHTRPKEVAIEYADSKSEAALAAFERPSSQPVAAAPKPAAPAPEATQAKPATPKKRRIDETEPYMGKTANDVRTLEDAVELPDEPATTGVVTQPDSATDATTENLNELAPAPSPPATTATQDPYATQPATLPARKALPTSAPISDEPTTSEEIPVAPAPKPASKPVVAAPAPKPATTAPAKPAAPLPAPTAATPTPKPMPPAAAPATGAVEAIPANGLHTVQPKETLYSVARRYGLRPADLVAWNNLPQNPSLRLGQVLRVTAGGAAAPAPAAVPAPSVAKPAPAVGKTGIYQPKTVAVPASSPAAKPAAAPVAAPAAATSVRHTVAAGESMYAISRKYGVTIKQIMEWNNKPDFNVKPGEVLTIKPAN